RQRQDTGYVCTSDLTRHLVRFGTTQETKTRYRLCLYKRSNKTSREIRYYSRDKDKIQ
ncbi:hypothetical protein CHS0354_027525, partial [Potamilus streckersoni]